MQVLYQRCAAIDIGKDVIAVAVRVPGDGPDAILARAERQIEDGDVVGALATLDTLPADAKDALGPWRDRAERRAKIDREIARIRAQALQDLSQLARSGG